MSPEPVTLAPLTTFSFRSMGVDVLVGGADHQALADVTDLFGEWERVFSRFRADSELTRVNRSPHGAVLVSPLFGRATAVALAAARATGGLVDPTLGAALEGAGYDADFAALDACDPRPPGTAEPGRLNQVVLTGRLLMRPSGLLLDLNGVVKSLAVDEALRLLPAAGFVSAGGDLGTRAPVIVGLPGGGSISLESGGLATSGSTERSWRRAGSVQHHLLDPRTGRPSLSRWTQVTVAAGSCVAADVAAKAAFLLSDDGPAWLDERGLPGRFLAGNEVVTNEAWC
jgi:thiamine biosynthesis lipoprotein